MLEALYTACIIFIDTCRNSYGKCVLGILNAKLGICNERTTSVVVFRSEQFVLLTAVSDNFALYITLLMSHGKGIFY